MWANAHSLFAIGPALLVAALLGLALEWLVGARSKATAGSDRSRAPLARAWAVSIGAILAVILFSLSVISFPILLDRDIDFITAMITSVQTVVKNPLPMLGWAFVVVMLLIAASLPMFLGLVVVLPILGHATWHIYRMAIEPEEAPAPAKGK